MAMARNSRTDGEWNLAVLASSRDVCLRALWVFSYWVIIRLFSLLHWFEELTKRANGQTVS